MSDNQLDIHETELPQTDSDAVTSPQTQSEEHTPSQTQSVSEPEGGGSRPRVIPIDLRRTVQTDADKDRNDLLDLLESQRSSAS